jgi:hypothetical protein
MFVLNVTNSIDILTEDPSLHVGSPHCVHIANKSTHLEKNGPLNTLPVRIADFDTVHVMTQMLKERILIHFSVRHTVGVIGVGKINIIVFPTAFLLPILITTTITPLNTRTVWEQVADNHLRAIVIIIFVFLLAHIGQMRYGNTHY